MPAIIIAQQPDGSFMVNAVPEAPPEMLQDAIAAADLTEAMGMVQEALGGAPGAEGAPMDQEGMEGDGQPAPAAEGGSEMGMEAEFSEEDDAMQAGFDRANKGL